MHGDIIIFEGLFFAILRMRVKSQKKCLFCVTHLYQQNVQNCKIAKNRPVTRHCMVLNVRIIALQLNLLVQVTFDGDVGNQVPALVPLLSQVICRAVLYWLVCNQGHSCILATLVTGSYEIVPLVSMRGLSVGQGAVYGG